MSRFSSLLVLLFVFTNLFGQYGDEKKYLIDSLDLNDIPKAELSFLDSCLNEFHSTELDTNKVKIIGEIIEKMSYYRWIDYHYIHRDLVKFALQKELSDDEKYFYLNQYAQNLGNTGFIMANQGQMDSAIHYFQLSLKELEIISNQDLMATTYNNMGYIYRATGNLEKAIENYNKSKELFEELDSKEGIAMNLNNVGRIYEQTGEIEKALESYEASLKIRKELGNTEEVALTLNNIGYVKKNQGDIEGALEKWNECLVLMEEIQNEQGMAVILGNLGTIFEEQGDDTTALSYFERSLNLSEKIDFFEGQANALSNIGSTYESMDDTSKAVTYFLKSKELNEKIQNPNGVATSLNNLGNLYLKHRDPEKALEYYSESEKLERKIENKEGLAIALNFKAQAYFELHELSKAEENALTSLELGKELGFPNIIGNTAKTLSKIYEAKGEGLKSLKMYKLSVQMEDSINNEETQRAAARQLARYEYEKKKVLDDAEREKERAVSAEKEKNQRTVIYAVVGGLILTLLFAIFIFNRLQVTRSQKKTIEEQKVKVEEQRQELKLRNEEITDSIAYASRIQEAILPPANFMKEHLPDSFVFYRPKDIVAGDFYWMEVKGDFVFYATADCTGHGVPGAMVSVVCSNSLNRAVNEFNLTDPGQILDKTTELVVATFEKSEQEVKDGMDVTLIRFNSKKKEVLFAGANNPLYVVRKLNGRDISSRIVANKTHYIDEIKGDKQPVGKYADQKAFNTHKIDVETGDILFTFSDGFADQFGGPKGKKYMYKPFKRLLLECIVLNHDQQEKALEKSLTAWKGSLEQVDDILVIGVRI